MANVTVDADIKAKWPQGQCSYSPGNPEELAIIAVDLLVKELGTPGALSFIEQVFGKYAGEHGHYTAPPRPAETEPSALPG